MRKALLLVDIQNDFLPGGRLPVPEGDRIVPLVNKLQEEFDLILATKDWHPLDHGSFASNHPGKEPGDVINLHNLIQILWPVHCVQSTEGAEFPDGLDTSKIEKVFYKGIDAAIDSYSGFFDNGHKRSTGLSDYLISKNVKTIFIVGLAADFCVKYTAIDAVELGFETFVIKDATKAVNLKIDDFDSAIKEMEEAGVHVLESVEL
jgi:nicotinamidase/pyrazinamidase